MNTFSKGFGKEPNVEKGQVPPLSVRKDKFLVAPDLSLIICLHYFVLSL